MVCDMSESEAPDGEERVISRRKLLGLGLGVAAGLCVADRTAETLTHDERPPHLALLDNVTDTKNRDSAIICMAGFGRVNPIHIAETLVPMVGSKGRLGYLDYGNTRIDIDALLERLSPLRARGFRRLSLYGESMGGMVAMQLAANAIVQGIEIERLFLDCTPARLADIRDVQRWGTYIVEHGLMGPVTRLMGELVVRSTDHPTADPIDNFSQAYGKATRGIANPLMRSEADFISRFQPDQYVQILREAGVKVIYLRPLRASDDVMVDVDASERRLQGLLGGSMRTYKAHISHASITYNPRAYEDMVVLALQEEQHDPIYI